MAIHGVDLREFRQTCRIRVKVEGEEKIVKVFIGRNTHNTAPIGEKIRLVPGGWYNTDDVELLEVLDWED